MSMILDDIAFLTMIASNGYRDPKPIRDGSWYACIAPFLFTHAIIIGRMRDTGMYEDRWCYESYAKAKEALDAWDGEGEPDGWHRHPTSGRRRENGDASKERIAP